MEVEITFRQAIPTDADTILSCIKQMSKISDTVYFDPVLQRMTIEEFSQQLAGVYDSLENLFFLALIEDMCVGLVSIYEVIPGYGEVGIAVLPEYQKMGIGTILLEEACYWFEEESSLVALCLSVLKENLHAKTLYQRVGFQVDSAIETILLKLGQVEYLSYKKGI